jgi:hypothetical protein
LVMVGKHERHIDDKDREPEPWDPVYDVEQCRP